MADLSGLIAKLEALDGPSREVDAERVVNGTPIRCDRCDGGGVVATWSFDGPLPDECPDCGGSGRNWQYAGGAIASYYGGPLLGRARPIPDGRDE